MGKKKDDSKLTKFVNGSVAVVYVVINCLMFSMLVIRIVTVSMDRNGIDIKTFPQDCISSRLDGCSRIVLDKLYCRHIENL